MRAILTDHTRRYPLWAVDDLYKLIHQAALGSEHAVGDPARARGWLRQELAQLHPGPDEPLIDPISPGGEIVRVHLRPFARLCLDEETLLQAFIRTAQEQGSVERLAEYAHSAIRLAEGGALSFPAGDLSAYLAARQAAGWPAAHHSPGYRQAYRPAYRVVAWKELAGEMIAAAQ